MKKKVHITDIEGNPKYNLLFDDGSNVLVFADDFGFVDRLTVERKRWKIVPGWLSCGDWNETKRNNGEKEQ